MKFESRGVEFFRVMRFVVEQLIGDEGVGVGAGFVEAVICEFLNVQIELFRFAFIDAIVQTSLDELLFIHLHLGDVFFGNGSSEKVGIAC